MYNLSATLTWWIKEDSNYKLAVIEGVPIISSLTIKEHGLSTARPPGVLIWT